jgi:hypothetical protein
MVRAPSIATLPVGSVTPGSLGAHWRERNGRPAASPERRRPVDSRVSSGAAQPGYAMSGSESSRCASRASCAGHEVRCVPECTPSDCTPMLMLVPMAT